MNHAPGAIECKDKGVGKTLYMRMNFRSVAAPFAVALFATTAGAATFTPCNDPGFSFDATGAVSSNIGCHVIGGVGARLGIGDFEGFLGVNEWKKRGDLPASGLPAADRALSLDADGNWQVANWVFRTFDHAVLVFRKKGRHDFTAPGGYIAYELDDTSGSFTSPFRSLKGREQPIGRITLLAGRATVPPPLPAKVIPNPLPAAGLLLLTGLLGLGALARRRG